MRLKIRITCALCGDVIPLGKRVDYITAICSRACSNRARSAPIDVCFLAKVDMSGPMHPYNNALGCCHTWTASLHIDGYGQFQPRPGITMRAHRYAWSRVHGPIPDKLHVLHTCDRLYCVNVLHLYLGTHADNMHDKMVRGRSGSARVTEEQVREIRRRALAGESHAAISRSIGLSHSATAAIVTRRAWKHVE